MPATPGLSCRLTVTFTSSPGAPSAEETAKRSSPWALANPVMPASMDKIRTTQINLFIRILLYSKRLGMISCMEPDSVDFHVAAL